MRGVERFNSSNDCSFARCQAADGCADLSMRKRGRNGGGSEYGLHRLRDCTDGFSDGAGDICLICDLDSHVEISESRITQMNG